MSPWASDLYGNSKFAVTNVSAKFDKEWELDKCSDPNSPDYNLLLWKAAGDDKLYTQRLNGVIGIGFWF